MPTSQLLRTVADWCELLRILEGCFWFCCEAACDAAPHLVHVGLETSTFGFLFVHDMLHRIGRVLSRMKVFGDIHIPRLLFTELLNIGHWNNLFHDRFSRIHWVKVEFWLLRALLCGGHGPSRRRRSFRLIMPLWKCGHHHIGCFLGLLLR